MNLFKSAYGKLITLTMAFLLATIGLGGCSSGNSDNYAGVCRNPTTQERLPDNQCNGGDSNSHALVYFLAGAAVAAVGAKLYNYHRSVPSNANIYRGYVPNSGGNASFKRQYNSIPNGKSKYSDYVSKNNYGGSTSNPSASNYGGSSKSSKVKEKYHSAKAKVKSKYKSYKSKRSRR